MRKNSLIVQDGLGSVINEEGKALVRFRDLNIYEDLYSDSILRIVKDFQKHIAKPRDNPVIPDIDPSDFFDLQRVPVEMHRLKSPFHWLATGTYQGGVEISLRKVPILWAYDETLAKLIIDVLKTLIRGIAKKEGIQANSIEFEMYSINLIASTLYAELHRS